jgi:glycine cleavage system transcriptional repressor
MKQNYLVITALGKDRPGLVSVLSQSIYDAGCNVEDSRMTVLGGEFAIILLVSGKWNAVAKLENSLGGLGQRLGLEMSHRRTEERAAKGDLLPYAVDVAALDQPGIVNHLASFFAERGINIEDMVTNRYAAAHTGTPMFSVHINIGIPANTHIATLREEFLDFCDRLNLDAVMDPIKA